MTNATLFKEGEGRKIIDSGAFGYFPNGIYKTSMSWYNDEDEKIAELTYFIDANYHVNNVNGNSF